MTSKKRITQECMANAIYYKRDYYTVNGSIHLRLFGRSFDNSTPGIEQEFQQVRTELPAGTADNFRFLQQVHDKNVLVFESATSAQSMIDKSNSLSPFYHLQEADAACTTQKQLPIGIRIADCIPLVMYDKHGKSIAGIHAGWRGLRAQIIEQTVQTLQKRFGVASQELMITIGPCIAQRSYETGPDVYQNFSAEFSRESDNAGKKLLDLNSIAVQQLLNLQVPAENITNLSTDTFADPRFFSHRAGDSGRNVFLIYKLPH